MFCKSEPLDSMIAVNEIMSVNILLINKCISIIFHKFILFLIFVTSIHKFVMLTIFILKNCFIHVLYPIPFYTLSAH
jgi:hypothetical protein